MELKRSQQGTGPAHGTRSGRPIAAWLLACCALVFAMVAVGGVTRLTHSGLSIVEWQPIVGTIPPLNEQQWLETFEKYQKTPEFRLVNHAMTVSEFKGIFWWEYFHRLLGRLIGVVFLVPMIWFALRRRIDGRLGIRLAGIFALGAAQGAMGWYMVKSGLVDDPRVSQFRLTAHLGLAFLILAAMLWVALDQLRPRASPGDRAAAIGGAARAPRRLAWWVTGISAYMVLTGGLVAGIRAGYAYNTFPLMNGQIVPAEIAMLTPWWKNFFYNMATVQFDHRMGAWVLAVLGPLLWLRLRRAAAGLQAEGGAVAPAWLASAARRAGLLLVLLALQIALGISTLLTGVAVPLAVSHQAVAVLVFAAALAVNHALAAPPAAATAVRSSDRLVASGSTTG
jgi:cytochrome c oxidase assembly protein subunit 15